MPSQPRPRVTPQAADPAPGPGVTARVQPVWDARAACRGEDPSLFFGPPRFEPKRERLVREAAAKQVCSGCAVLSPCRQFALDTGELFGVWGGLGEAERRPLITSHNPGQAHETRKAKRAG